jgi:hypothetical protein
MTAAPCFENAFQEKSHPTGVQYSSPGSNGINCIAFNTFHGKWMSRRKRKLRTGKGWGTLYSNNSMAGIQEQRGGTVSGCET